MCKFFSLISDGAGRVRYFDAELRDKILGGKLKDKAGRVIENSDSHSSIAAYYRLDEDHHNKWEYSPITGKFTRDQVNTLDDSELVEKLCNDLDFKTIVPCLIIHPIVHPLRVRRHNVTKADVDNLQRWDSVGHSVWDSVWDSVGDSVWDSVWDSVGDSVWDSVRDSVRHSVRHSVRDSVRDSVGHSVGHSVWDSVWDSVGDSVWDSVRDSVGHSVWHSVWDSVGDSVWAYASSFFDLEKWKYIDHKPGVNPYQPLIDLWDRGFVPSFDGKTWRLHQGKGAKIVYEWVREV